MARGKNNEQKQNAKTVGERQSNKRQPKTKGKDAAEKVAKVAAAEEKISPAAKAKAARIAEWEKPENLTRLRGWTMQGLSMDQIAHKMGFKSKQTLYNYCDSSLAILDAIKKGKEVADFEVVNALFTSAISGNVVAQIFWLKNRMPDEWKDKTEQHIQADVEETGGVIYLPKKLEEVEENE